MGGEEGHLPPLKFVYIDIIYIRKLKHMVIGIIKNMHYQAIVRSAMSYRTWSFDREQKKSVTEDECIVGMEYLDGCEQ